MKTKTENKHHFRTLQTLTAKVLLVLAAVALLIGSCSKNPSGPAETEARDLDQQVKVDSAIVDWLKAKCLPFDTQKAESGFADIAYLKDLVAGARIVGLGEATHGTKEFSQMKHGILEYLVKEMGFNTFAIEVTWPEANLMNDYVMTGQGDPVRLLAGLYSPWNTREVLDMVQWMSRHNENPGSAPKVGFFGFDMQYPKMAMDNVIAYLTKVDPPAVSWASSLYAGYRIYENNISAYTSASESIKTECRRYISEIYDSLAAHQLEYVTKSSAKEFAWGLQSARVVVQNELEFCETSAGYHYRDYFMAENARWLLDQSGPNGKIVLWAHNLHVSTRDRWMGGYLRYWYGDQMVVFGFDFYAGSFNANPVKAGTYPPFLAGAPPSDSYEYVFRWSNLPRFFLDLRDPSSPPAVGSWILGPRKFRNVGSTYDVSSPSLFFYTTPLTKEYDVVVYFQDTSPSVLLPF
jgi:erythromycin esterase